VQKSIAIIGGGPAGMALAANLDNEKFAITLYEKNKTLGRKFLVAGKGGFNLTHNTPMPAFAEKYTPNHFLKNTLQHFDNVKFRNWLEQIGIPTFVGTSHRVFPEEGIKPIEVLNAIKKVLAENKVKIKFEHSWTGWDIKGNLNFENQTSIKHDIVVFALGGSSWKVTGSNGEWLSSFDKNKIDILPFFPSNCAYQIRWPKSFLADHEGKPLKNIALTCDGKTAKGEVVLTKFGMEGNAIYALSPEIRRSLQKDYQAIINVDLKPTLTKEVILEKLNKATKKNTSDVLKKVLHLSSTQLSLLKHFTSKVEYLNIEKLVHSIKSLPLKIIDHAPIDEAISTVGGVALNSIDKNFIGEMLDWDAPTGGYLLQACFSMGFKLADHLNNKY